MNGALRLPPHAVESEQAVLGSLLLESSRLAEIEVTENDFYRSDHRTVFCAINELVGKRQAVDLVTLTEHLRAQGKLEEAGGISYLATLARDTPGAANIAAYAGIVQARSQSRRAAEIAGTLLADLTSPGAVDATIRALMELTLRERNYSSSIKESLGEVMDLIDARFKGFIKSGLGTGLKRLDSCLGGMSAGHLYVVAARPAMGKTGFGSGLLLANRERPTGFMSMEQPKTEVIARMAASIASVSAHALRTGKISDEDWPRLAGAFDLLGGVPCYINDQPAPSIDVIVRQVRKWKYEHDIQLCVVDYMQRIRSVGAAPRHEQVENFARTLKELARELKIPVVALCQVNRNVETRNDKRPQMGDLRDSGAIEQEADVIITLYREEVYYDEPNNKGVAEIAVIKNRHGPLGKLTCHFNAASIRFEDSDGELDSMEGRGGADRGRVEPRKRAYRGIPDRKIAED